MSPENGSLPSSVSGTAGAAGFDATATLVTGTFPTGTEAGTGSGATGAGVAMSAGAGGGGGATATPAAPATSPNGVASGWGSARGPGARWGTSGGTGAEGRTTIMWPQLLHFILKERPASSSPTA